MADAGWIEMLGNDHRSRQIRRECPNQFCERVDTASRRTDDNEMLRRRLLMPGGFL
jgi:hypothetical protein